MFHSNTAVMMFKFGAYLYTGSATMLSESIHSLADLLNQVMLMQSTSQKGEKAGKYTIKMVHPSKWRSDVRGCITWWTKCTVNHVAESHLCFIACFLKNKKQRKEEKWERKRGSEKKWEGERSKKREKWKAKGVLCVDREEMSADEGNRRKERKVESGRRKYDIHVFSHRFFSLVLVSCWYQRIHKETILRSSVCILCLAIYYYL